MTAGTFFSRDELLDGLPARRASTLLFAIESRTAHLVAQARQAMARFVTGKTAAERERAFLEALAQGRNPPIQPTIQDLERYAPDWADLAPEEPGIRAAVAKLLGQKYTFTARDVPQLRQVLGLDDAAVQASYQRSYGQPLASIFAPAVGRRERLRWAWANLAGRLENLPPFWTAFALTLTETVTEGLLALPIALAGVGPLAGVVLLVVFGLINMLTIAAMSESIVRNGNMRYGHAYLGRLVSDYLGGAGSLLMFMAFLILSVVALLACGVGLATTLADATGIPAVAWVAVLFLVNLAVLRRESLDATVASALLIGGVNVALIIILSLLALPHVRAANLLYTNVPFVGGRPFDASVLELIFGVILVAYLGHASAANCAKVVLRRDPGGRALIWGSVAALGCATALYALCIVAINGAVAPELLAHATGTALQPLAAQVGPAVLALGAVYVVLSLGFGSVHESLSLFFQVREWLPAERPIQPEERAANGQEVATRPWFSVLGSWFLDRRGRFWLGVAPVALIFLLVEWLLLTERVSFAGSIGFLGTIAAPLLGGIFPLLLLAASRRTGDYTPSLVFRLLGHPAVIVGLYALFLASIFLHGLLIWRDPFERMAALFVGLLTVAATVASLRRGVLRARAAIELRLDRAAGGAANFNVTVAGRPATASVRLVYANGERRLRAASGVIEVFGDLRSAAFHLPASAARELKVWAHQLTPAGDTRPLPARLAIHDGTAIQRCDLRESDGQAIVPIGQAPYQAQLTFVNLPAVRPAAPPPPAPRARPWRPAAVLTTCALAAVVAILGGWALPAAGPPQSAFAEPGFPLDPLSAAEMRTAVAVLKQDGKLAPDAIFPVIRLREPPKAEVLRFAPGQPLRREAAVTVFNRSQNKTYQAIVDVRNARLLDLRELPGVQPLITNTEYYEVPPLVRSDPHWQAAMRKRGIADFEHVYLDVWAPGESGDGRDPPGVRLARVLSFYQGESTNAYGRPIEGVVVVVNLNAMRVDRVTDTGVVPVAAQSSAFDPQVIGATSAAPKPLEFSQPQGPSFEIRGNEISWQKWRFRYAVDPIEGLVLYLVRYDDGGKLRSVLYRAAISEMTVPYGDADQNWIFRSAFDVGEYGMGLLTTPIDPLTDAPANAVLLDAQLADDQGEPFEIPRAVAVYERDGGLLWKHWDSDAEVGYARRARELVVFYVTTIGNYDYGFSYIFRQDGVIQADVNLLGIMLAKGSAAGSPGAPMHDADASAHLVGSNILAPNHQHFFAFRLDMDVDGQANSLVELNSQAPPAGPQNPHGNAFVMQETALRTEQQAQRDLNFASSRAWKVINPNVTNALGANTSYILAPGENAIPYALPDSPIRRRAAFLNHHLWATRYQSEELAAAGPYPNQSKGGDGLVKYSADDASLVDQDLVLWYTLGVTHIPRPEEWPVMPTAHAGFRLIPAGFFAQNPGLYVPGPANR